MSRVTFIVPLTSFFHLVNQVKALVYASGLCIAIKRKKENQPRYDFGQTWGLKHQGVTLVLSNNHGDYAYDLRWSYQPQGPIEGAEDYPRAGGGGGGA